MITIYTDPMDGNQVMAIYHNCKPGDPSVWTSQGFDEIDITSEMPTYRDVIKYGRECQVNGDVVTSRVNPVQPVPPPRTRLDDLRDKLSDDTITPAEIREMLRLERGL